MLAVYFVAVFPANIHNALNGLAVDGLPQAGWYYWLRLPFQPLAILWALYASGVFSLPKQRVICATSSRTDCGRSETRRA